MNQLPRYAFMAVLVVMSQLTGCTPDESTQIKDVATAPQAGVDHPAPASIEQTYLRSCHSCHGTGIAGAPRTGDLAAWSPRMEKGMDTLVANAINGYQAMPPRGLCFDCTEEQFAALIAMMASEQGAQ